MPKEKSKTIHPLGLALLLSIASFVSVAASLNPPFPSTGPIASPYGPRLVALPGSTVLEFKFHKGIDYKRAVGTPVLAVQAGEITTIKKDNGGNYLVAVTSGGHYFSYLHLFSDSYQLGQVITGGGFFVSLERDPVVPDNCWGIAFWRDQAKSTLNRVLTTESCKTKSKAHSPPLGPPGLFSAAETAVSAGTVIALSGQSGGAAGRPHMHLELVLVSDTKKLNPFTLVQHDASNFQQLFVDEAGNPIQAPGLGKPYGASSRYIVVKVDPSQGMDLDAVQVSVVENATGSEVGGALFNYFGTDGTGGVNKGNLKLFKPGDSPEEPKVLPKGDGVEMFFVPFGFAPGCYTAAATSTSIDAEEEPRRDAYQFCIEEAPQAAIEIEPGELFDGFSSSYHASLAWITPPTDPGPYSCDWSLNPTHVGPTVTERNEIQSSNCAAGFPLFSAAVPSAGSYEIGVSVYTVDRRFLDSTTKGMTVYPFGLLPGAQCERVEPLCEDPASCNAWVVSAQGTAYLPVGSWIRSGTAHVEVTSCGAWRGATPAPNDVFGLTCYRDEGTPAGTTITAEGPIFVPGVIRMFWHTDPLTGSRDITCQ